MKCGEPMPGSSYQTCDRDLKHSGNHAHRNQRWPRPVPAGPDWDVQEFLEDAIPANAYGIEERSYPIVVTETVTRIIWVDAESEDEALAYWADDWTDIPLKSAGVIDGYLEFERPDEFQRQEAFRANRFEQKIGPLIQCPDCGKDSFRRAWYHDPYRKCHGPIQWKIGGHGKPMRDYQQNPVGGAA
jgi:hypothetical protein